VWGSCVGEQQPTAEDCKTPADEDCNGVAEKCPLDTVWAKAYPVPSLGASPPPIAVDPMGNIIYASGFTGTVDFGTGPMAPAGGSDIYVVKIDDTGATQWARRYGDSADQNAYAAATSTAGDVFVTGTFQGSVDFGNGAPITSAGGDDAYLLKLTPTGATTWVAFGGDASSQTPTAVAAMPDGGAVISGSFYGVLQFPGCAALTAPTSGSALFLTRFAPDGTCAASVTLGSMAGYPYVNQVTSDAAGNVYVAGEFSGTVSFPGFTATALGSTDGFVAKLDGSSLFPAWVKTFGSAAMDAGDGVASGTSISADANGNVLITGYITDTVDVGGTMVSPLGPKSFLVAQLGPDGSTTWAKAFGNCGVSSVNSQMWGKLNAKGHVVLVGFFAGDVDFGGGDFMAFGAFDDADGFLVELDGQGNHLASRHFGDSTMIVLEALISVGLDASDNIYGMGFALGQIDLGTGPLGTAGAVSLALARFAP